MKQIIAALFFLLTVPGIQAQQTIVNDANAAARSISGSFTQIKVSGGFDVYLSQSETEALAVSASEPEYRDRIRTEVNNGTLNVYYDSRSGWTKGNKKLKVYISFRNLEKLDVSGACDVHVAGTIRSHNLSMELSGASEFKGSVDAESLKFNLSGASDANVKGKAGNLQVHASGASDFKAYDLSAENCTAQASGASDIQITVNKELNVRASGASDVFYKGACVIRDLESSGASTVARKGS